MANNRKRLLAAAAATAMALALAACGGGSDGGSKNSSSSSSGSGKAGGTLTYYFATPLGHTDPQRTYVGVDIINFTRTIYRQLVTYPVSTDRRRV